MKKIGIVGTRRRDEQIDLALVIKHFFEIYQEGDEIVSGGCPKGADRFAEIIAKRFGIPIKIYYPNWDKFGRAAGLMRNGKIAVEADLIIAMVALDRTGGTEDTIRKAKKLDKKVIIIGD